VVVAPPPRPRLRGQNSETGWVLGCCCSKTILGVTITRALPSSRRPQIRSSGPFGSVASSRSLGGGGVSRGGLKETRKRNGFFRCPGNGALQPDPCWLVIIVVMTTTAATTGRT